MNRLRQASLLLTVSALALVAPPAHAERKSYDDVRADMVVRESTDRAPQAKEGDIKRVTTNHQRSRLTVTTKYVARPDQFVGLRIAVPRRKFYVSLGFFNFPGMPPGEAIQLTEEGVEEPVTCPGLRHVTMPDHAQAVRVRIPRSCLGDPRWVRVGSYAASDENGVSYADESRRVGGADEQYKIRVGPKVKPG